MTFWKPGQKYLHKGSLSIITIFFLQKQREAFMLKVVVILSLLSDTSFLRIFSSALLVQKLVWYS